MPSAKNCLDEGQTKPVWQAFDIVFAGKQDNGHRETRETAALWQVQVWRTSEQNNLMEESHSLSKCCPMRWNFWNWVSSWR